MKYESLQIYHCSLWSCFSLVAYLQPYQTIGVNDVVVVVVVVMMATSFVRGSESKDMTTVAYLLLFVSCLVCSC